MGENNILATILAGGKSRRFGTDKSLAKLGNKSLIDHTVSKIEKNFSEILIVSNKQIIDQKKNNINIIEDCLPGQLGPLVGVLSAMKWIKKNNKNYKWISTFPSDTPFFTKNELQIFYKKIDIQKSKLFFIKNKQTRHNIFGLWSMDLMEKLDNDLKKGERKVEVWADTAGVEIINIEYEKKDPFFNINTKEDLEKAIKIMNND